MLEVGKLLCLGLRRSVASILPWDIPWYDPSHTVFFTAVYGALTVIGLGVVFAVLVTIKRMKEGGEASHH